MPPSCTSCKMTYTERCTGTKPCPAYRRAVAYVAGPYRAPTSIGVAWNIARAVCAGQALAAAGFSPLVPHVIGNRCDPHNQLGDDYWLDATMELMLRSDLVVLMPDWVKSVGARCEKNRAVVEGIPHYLLRDLCEVPDVLGGDL